MEIAMQVIKLSPSAARSFRNCPHRYALDYVQRLPAADRTAVPMLAFGNAVHQALADFIREGGWARLSQDDLVAIFMRHWNGAVYADTDIEMSQFHYGRRLLEAFYDRPFPSNPLKEQGTELRLSWAKPRKNILATGKIDRLCEIEDGRLLVIDYKVGRFHPQAEEDLDVQATFYRSLVADTIARANPMPIEIVFYFLGSQSTLTVEFTHEDFLRIWESLEETAERIRASTVSFHQGRPLWAAFPLHRGHQCLSCPMKSHCEQVQEHPSAEPTRDYPDAKGGNH
jgi:hypothetical protein